MMWMTYGSIAEIDSERSRGSQIYSTALSAHDGALYLIIRLRTHRGNAEAGKRSWHFSPDMPAGRILHSIYRQPYLSKSADGFLR